MENKKNSESAGNTDNITEISEKKSAESTNIIVIIVSLILGLMSGVMIFVENVETVYLCYGACTMAVIAGIYLIVRYFMKDSYRNVNAYGFSGGTLLVLLGICGIIRVDTLAGAFIAVLGMCLLLLGIVVMQHSLDLGRMGDHVWIPVFIVAALILICGILVMTEPFADKIRYDEAVWWMVMISAGLGIIINVYTMVRVHMFKKKEKKATQASLSEGNSAETDTGMEEAFLSGAESPTSDTSDNTEENS